MFLFGGVLADRYDRRKVMIAADLIRVAGVAGLALLTFLGILEVWHMVILAGLYGTGGALFIPASNALIPQLVPARLLVNANAVDQLVKPVTKYLLGPALGGVLLSIGGAGVAFTVDACTFGVVLLALLAIRTTDLPAVTGRLTVRKTVTDIKEGFAFVRSQRWLWTNLLTVAIGVLCYWGPLKVLVPVLVKNKLGGGASAYGTVLAAGGVGAALTAVLITVIGVPRRCMTPMYLILGFACATIGLLALATQAWHAMLVLFASQGAFAVATIIWLTVVQSNVPSHIRGRVTSFDWFVSVSLMPLSYLLVVPVSKAIGVGGTLIAGSLLAAIAAVAVLTVPGIREFELREEDELSGSIVEQPDTRTEVPIPA